MEISLNDHISDDITVQTNFPQTLCLALQTAKTKFKKPVRLTSCNTNEKWTEDLHF